MTDIARLLQVLSLASSRRDLLAMTTIRARIARAAR